ncbi:N-acetylmuramoyl-L-alanine amidase family protein [Fusobacterium sp. HC1336]|uniref:N-acetylmuramoyl-L-alanine amidase family protein n=1 Tax=Fusobacterium sp. HC1336 TaxID=3171169 RepID=UPI003F28EC19
MKKFFILFLIITSFCFGGTISSVIKSGSKLTFNFTGSNKSAYQINYDSYNRLIFVEFPGSNLSTKINDKNYSSKYVEEFSTIDYGGSVGFFIKLNKNISYSTSFSGNDFVFTFNDKSAKKQYTIAIDAGHGGKDPGAIGFNKYYEKNIALAVAKYLRDDLKKDFNIVMTRDSDVFVTLGERPRIANRAKADMFISIHVNSAVKNTLSGMEVFYFSKKSSPYAERIAAFENSVGDKYGEKTSNIVQIMGELAYKKNQEISIGFAKKTSAALAKGLGMKDRGIHGANFAVLRGFNGPGVLVELGFINNKDDINKLINANSQKKMAQEIAKMVRENFY